MKRFPTREQRRAARLILDDARDGVPVSADAITDALAYSGDLPMPDEEDDFDLLPVRRVHRAAGEWERQGLHFLAPARWVDALPH